jgi:hypothetical protein
VLGCRASAASFSQPAGLIGPGFSDRPVARNKRALCINLFANLGGVPGPPHLRRLLENPYMPMFLASAV